jgi:hypothetical protein
MKTIFRTSTYVKVGQFYLSIKLPLKSGERRFRVTRDHSRFQNYFEMHALGFTLGRMWSTHAQRIREKRWLNSLEE